jgi:hypothetical protein
MSMSELEQAFRLIESTSGAKFHGQKVDELISRAELALGMTFPPTYRRFLGSFGCGHIRGREVYGIIDDDFENSSAPDAIWLTLEERRSSHLPKTAIVIGSTGDGGYYVIDRSQLSTEGESPVIEWWPGLRSANRSRRTVADDFGSFLLQQVQEAR